MAESRGTEEAEERGAQRDVRSRSQKSDHPERTKPDLLHLSPGPLSSIRAAIRRTRTTSQGNTPETEGGRRSPSSQQSLWPGTAGFQGRLWVSPPPLPPPPPQAGWSAGLQPVPQPPPSYDQVIQEKTQEEHSVRPTAAPRKVTCTATSATQTDPCREEAGRRSTGKKPKKPPRPSVPKPEVKEPEIFTASTSETRRSSSPEDPPPPYTRSITVHWGHPENLLSAPAADAPPSTPDPGQRPVPRPRAKPRTAPGEGRREDQTLIQLSDSSEEVHPDPAELNQNQYLKELLEVFNPEPEREETPDATDQSHQATDLEDAGAEMSSNSQRNILARIQAFENQTSAEGEDAVEPAKPQPQPRKAAVKPPVAAKPSAALRPPFNQSADEDDQNVSTNVPQPPTPAPRPQPPKKPQSVKEELESLQNKFPQRSRPSVLTRASCVYEEEPGPAAPPVPLKPPKEPLKPNLNINNHNSASVAAENEYVESPANPIPARPRRSVGGAEASLPGRSLTRRPTTIRVPSKSESLSDPLQDIPPPLPAQKPVGHLNHSREPVPPVQEASLPGPSPSLPPRRQSTKKTPPPRPPPAKTGPGRPPPPNLHATGRSHSASWDFSPAPAAQQSHRKGPLLPPRPNPGHRLYNNYTLPLPHGIASYDYNGTNTGELSFQKNEVLLLLEDIDPNTFECQVGEAKGRVHNSRMKVITPLSPVSNMSPPQGVGPAGSGGAGLKVQAMCDFSPEGPGELGLKAGDVVTMVEQVDSEWYRGTCRGSHGFFPINHVKVLSNSPPQPLPERKPKPPSAAVSGPRCVARFDFGGGQDELSFSEGDVIQLKELVGEEWARGQMGASSGLFPLNFVEVIEDLPPPPSPKQKHHMGIALPGMVASPSTHPGVAKPAQVSKPSVEWAVALYDFKGDSDGDLSFQQGDRILILEHLDAEWSQGRLNGKDGIFPRAFIDSSSGQRSSSAQQTAAAGGGRARALFDFTSDCEEELSLHAGDIITGLESMDDEWFLGDLRGKRALIPKNYVQVLG